MANRNRLSRRLAIALLAGSWTIEEIQDRLRSVLSPPPRARWISPLAARICQRFESDRLPPTHRRLAGFLNQDEILWDKVEQYDLSDGLQIDLLSLSRPRMTPGPGIPETWNLPELVTPGELAEWLSLSPAQLDWLADCHGRERFHRNPKFRHYHYRWLSKKRSGHRLIEEPKPLLKSIQRRILEEILNRIPPHESTHAYCPGRSILSYVAPHVGQDCVLHLDLRNFFPSIPQARIRSLFRWAGYPEAVAHLLAGFCTNAAPSEIFQDDEPGFDGETHQRLIRQLGSPHLPQGAPTSPALSNLAAYRLDCRLSGLARKVGTRYTRYADDLVFSGDRAFRKRLSRFRVAVMAIAIHEGFQINHQKTCVMPHGTRQEIAGLVLNRRPNIRREEFDQLRAILFNCIRFGPESQNQSGQENFKEHLQGRIAYHARIHVQRGDKLQRLFERIAW